MFRHWHGNCCSLRETVSSVRNWSSNMNGLIIAIKSLTTRIIHSVMDFAGLLPVAPALVRVRARRK
ncbi:MAG: hypothetical protein GMKNLPBB_00010 [Myxococcota bacterium]|nr:hypothetical protein [Myxococcota bacterium]